VPSDAAAVEQVNPRLSLLIPTVFNNNLEEKKQMRIFYPR